MFVMLFLKKRRRSERLAKDILCKNQLSQSSFSSAGMAFWTHLLANLKREMSFWVDLGGASPGSEMRTHPRQRVVECADHPNNTE